MIARIEFHGGCRDGMVVVGSDDRHLGPSKNPAHVYLCFTDGGRVGATFRETLPSELLRARMREYREKAVEAVRQGKPAPLELYPAEYHVYKVVDRCFEDGRVVIRLEYVKEEPRDRSVTSVGAATEPKRYEPVPLILNTLDDFRTMLTDPETARHGIYSFPNLPPGVQKQLRAPKRKRPMPDGILRRVRIIDAMTDVERRYPSTLIDQMARDRIAQDAGVSESEIKQLLQVFESFQGRPAKLSWPSERSKETNKERVVSCSDLAALPPRACVAFASRCALRAIPLVETLGQEMLEAAREIIDMAADYSTGKELSAQEYHETEQESWLLDRLRWPNDEWSAERHAFRAVSGAILAIHYIGAFKETGRWVAGGEFDFSTGLLGAVIGACDAFAADARNRYGILADLQLLREAVARGEITDETPIPMSLFPDPIKPHREASS